MQGKIILIVLMTAFFIFPALADIPVEGVKQYNYQYIINNTTDFPDYVFLTSSEIWGFEHPARVINGTFGGGYKLDGFVLHAMKGADLDATIQEQIDTPEQTGKNLTAYFATAPLATSDIVLPVSTGMNDSIPINNITVLLDVQEINGSVLNMTKVKTLIGFENGTIQEEMNNEEIDDALPGEEDLDLLHLI